MDSRRALMGEIDELPDFMVDRLLDIVHYIKLGIANEYVSQSDNEFYNSEDFQNIVADSVVEYQRGDTEHFCGLIRH